MHYIVIEGNIGVGKTSLAKKLANDLNALLILEEFENNPFLPKFYENPKRWAFACELSFLSDRYNQLKNTLLQPSVFHNIVISDYFFAKSIIFSKETLDSDEFNLFYKLFNIIYSFVPLPSLFVYLYAPAEKLKMNIIKRGRTYEQNISIDYLEKIEKSYQEFIQLNKDCFKIIQIDVQDIDFVNNEKDFLFIKKTILDNLKLF